MNVPRLIFVGLRMLVVASVGAACTDCVSSLVCGCGFADNATALFEAAHAAVPAGLADAWRVTADLEAAGLNVTRGWVVGELEFLDDDGATIGGLTPFSEYHFVRPDLPEGADFGRCQHVELTIGTTCPCGYHGCCAADPTCAAGYEPFAVPAHVHPFCPWTCAPEGSTAAYANASTTPAAEAFDGLADTAWAWTPAVPADDQNASLGATFAGPALTLRVATVRLLQPQRVLRRQQPLLPPAGTSC